LKPSFIWFDLGYTLLYKKREEAYANALKEMGFEVPPDALERAFHLTDKVFMREYQDVFGHDLETFMPWFLGLLNFRLGLRVDLGDAWTRMKAQYQTIPDYWRPFENAAGALEGLRRAGVRLGIISNWDLTARPILRRFGLEGFFERIVISSEVGLEKPAPEIFKLAMGQAGVSAAESLYVGDNYYVDAVGARQVGMDCLIVNRFGSLGVEELQGQTLIHDVSEVADRLG